MPVEYFKGAVLVLGLAALIAGILWLLTFLKTRDKTGAAYQAAKPRELKLRYGFWILFSIAAVCFLLLSCFSASS